MKINTLQALMFDTQILENGIIEIPQLKTLKNQDIQIIVIFKQQEKNNSKKVSLAGCLKKYANPALIEQETEIAWSKMKENKL